MFYLLIFVQKNILSTIIQCNLTLNQEYNENLVLSECIRSLYLIRNTFDNLEKNFLFSESVIKALKKYLNMNFLYTVNFNIDCVEFENNVKEFTIYQNVSGKFFLVIPLIVILYERNDFKSVKIKKLNKLYQLFIHNLMSFEVLEMRLRNLCNVFLTINDEIFPEERDINDIKETITLFYTLVKNVKLLFIMCEQIKEEYLQYFSNYFEKTNYEYLKENKQFKNICICYDFINKVTNIYVQQFKMTVKNDFFHVKYINKALKQLLKHVFMKRSKKSLTNYKKLVRLIPFLGLFRYENLDLFFEKYNESEVLISNFDMISNFKYICKNANTKKIKNLIFFILNESKIYESLFIDFLLEIYSIKYEEAIRIFKHIRNGEKIYFLEYDSFYITTYYNIITYIRDDILNTALEYLKYIISFIQKNNLDVPLKYKYFCESLKKEVQVLKKLFWKKYVYVLPHPIDYTDD